METCDLGSRDLEESWRATRVSWGVASVRGWEEGGVPGKASSSIQKPRQEAKDCRQPQCGFSYRWAAWSKIWDQRSNTFLSFFYDPPKYSVRCESLGLDTPKLMFVTEKFAQLYSTFLLLSLLDFSTLHLMQSLDSSSLYLYLYLFLIMLINISK